MCRTGRLHGESLTASFSVCSLTSLPRDESSPLGRGSDPGYPVQRAASQRGWGRQCHRSLNPCLRLCSAEPGTPGPEPASLPCPSAGDWHLGASRSPAVWVGKEDMGFCVQTVTQIWGLPRCSAHPLMVLPPQIH